jgi:hypothetical protein
MTKKIISFLIVIVAMALLNEAAAAAMGMGMGMGPPSPPCGTPPFPPCAVPVDGGIGLLAAAGIAYGTRKMMKRNKKNPA